MKAIHVTYRHDTPNNWSARSKDISGYFAGAETLEELRKLVFDGIPFFLGEPAEIIEIFEEPGQVLSELSA